ncbi:MAG: hypothetical protein IPK19_27155 [Chloroflexi bacterium]|nr:hypothetical protein [Chloroflexota bacterium]
MDQSLAVGADGALYIADSGNHRIRRRGTDGVITTVAGNGTLGFGGDGGLATEAAFAAPVAVAVSADGALIIADNFNNRIRRVGTDGIINTIVGNGEFGFSGDGGPATAAMLQYPEDVAVSSDGSLYIPDMWNHRIRRVGPDGIITTVAGNGSQGFGGDGGPATAASLAVPQGVAVGADGVLYIADWDNHRIRRVGSGGIITTIAGDGTAGFGGDGGPATEAWLNRPSGMAVGADGALYIADSFNDRIRRVALVEPAAVNAVLLLQGRPPAPHDQWIAQVTVTVVPSTGGAPVFHGAVTTDDVGVFFLCLTPGDYRMRVQGASSLARVVEILLTAGDNTVIVPELVSGDANQDNVVNINDFSMLAAAFGLTSDGPGFDARADFNADGVINISDFSLLASSFGQSGESL